MERLSHIIPQKFQYNFAQMRTQLVLRVVQIDSYATFFPCKAGSNILSPQQILLVLSAISRAPERKALGVHPESKKLNPCSSHSGHFRCEPEKIPNQICCRKYSVIIKSYFQCFVECIPLANFIHTQNKLRVGQLKSNKFYLF